jgi:glycosyltransferase involved in cell wall biosynthesis
LFVHRWGTIMAGGEVWIHNLARYLPADQVRVVAALHVMGPLSAALAEVGVPVRPIELEFLRASPRRAVVGSGLGLLRSALRLRGLIKETGARLVHAFSAEAAEVALVASRLARVPLVVTVMNCGPYPAIDGLVLRRSERVIAASRAVEADLLGLRVPPERVACIPTGISFDVPLRRRPGGLRHELGLTANDPLVGMVATLEPKKAQDVLLQAIPLVLDPFPAARFVFIGGDHSPRGTPAGPYWTALRQLARSLQVADRVHFLGFRPDARALLGELDVSVLCSRKEALGLAAIESLAAGVPLVATAVEGLREVVTDGATGLLVPPDSPSALAAGITTLLADRACAARLGAAGQGDARRRFDAAHLARQNSELYHSLVHPAALPATRPRALAG